MTLQIGMGCDKPVPLGPPAKCHSSHRWLQRSPSSWKGSMASMRRYEAVLYLLSHSQLCPEKLLDSQESSYHRLRRLLCLVQRARIYWTSMEWVSFCSNCCKNVKKVYNFKTAKIRNTGCVLILFYIENKCAVILLLFAFCSLADFDWYNVHMTRNAAAMHWQPRPDGRYSLAIPAVADARCGVDFSLTEAWRYGIALVKPAAETAIFGSQQRLQVLEKQRNITEQIESTWTRSLSFAF